MLDKPSAPRLHLYFSTFLIVKTLRSSQNLKESSCLSQELGLQAHGGTRGLSVKECRFLLLSCLTVNPEWR